MKLQDFKILQSIHVFFLCMKLKIRQSFKTGRGSILTNYPRFCLWKNTAEKIYLNERNTKILIKMLLFLEVTLLIFIITPLIER